MNSYKNNNYYFDWFLIQIIIFPRKKANWFESQSYTNFEKLWKSPVLSLCW